MVSPEQPEPAPPFETVVVGGVTRLRHNVNVVRIPAAERDIARTVMPHAAAVAERRYRPGLGGDAADDDAGFPVSSPESLAKARKARDAGESEPWRHLDGAPGWYTLLLTEDEAAQMRQASNVVAVTVDRRAERVGKPRQVRAKVRPQ